MGLYIQFPFYGIFINISIQLQLYYTNIHSYSHKIQMLPKITNTKPKSSSPLRNELEFNDNIIPNTSHDTWSGKLTKFCIFSQKGPRLEEDKEENLPKEVKFVRDLIDNTVIAKEPNIKQLEGSKRKYLNRYITEQPISNDVTLVPHNEKYIKLLKLYTQRHSKYRHNYRVLLLNRKLCNRLNDVILSSTSIVLPRRELYCFDCYEWEICEELKRRITESVSYYDYSQKYNPCLLYDFQLRYNSILIRKFHEVLTSDYDSEGE